MRGKGRFNFVSANPTKSPNTFKQFVGRRQQPTNWLSVFDHFVVLGLKGLRSSGFPSLNITVQSVAYNDH